MTIFYDLLQLMMAMAQAPMYCPHLLNHFSTLLNYTVNTTSYYCWLAGSLLQTSCERISKHREGLSNLNEASGLRESCHARQATMHVGSIDSTTQTADGWFKSSFIINDAAVHSLPLQVKPRLKPDVRGEVEWPMQEV